MLLLKSPVGGPTLSSSPEPTGVPLINTSTFKSTFSPVSLLVARPAQIFAGRSAVKNLGVGVGVLVGVFVGVFAGVFVRVFVGVGVLVDALGGVGVGVLTGALVGVGVFDEATV